jgi:fructosamine-3-kinase
VWKFHESVIFDVLLHLLGGSGSLSRLTPNRTEQDNTFRRSWAKFYAENRLRTISKLTEQAHGTDDELRMWIERTAAEIVPKLLGNGHLGDRKGISPALVHGDLWSGNKARGRLGGK